MEYPFEFLGGSKEIKHNGASAVVKFHLYVCDVEKQEEYHLFQAVKNGVVDQDKTRRVSYSSFNPVVKIFTSTRGFGIPQEYFSYFFMIQPSQEKCVNIKSLCFDKFNEVKNYYFKARGRFITEQEILRLYGKHSNTYKFYKRQSYISARRLKTMVSVCNVDENDVRIEEKPVRMLRL